VDLHNTSPLTDAVRCGTAYLLAVSAADTANK